MGSPELDGITRVLAGLLAVALLVLAFQLVAMGLRWSAIVFSGAFLIAFLGYGAVTGRWVKLFNRPRRR